MLRTLHLTGSAVDAFWSELSLMYARRCLERVADPGRYDVHLAHLTPDGGWRFPAGLGPAALAAAEPVPPAEAAARIAALRIDVMVPQLYDLPGMTHHRALFDVLGIPYVGNAPDVMALAAHKGRTRAVVAAAGVPVPRGEIVRAGDAVGLRPPLVVKPVAADNSLGVTLVRDAAALGPAIDAALEHGSEALVEAYVELGREVRCGALVRDGELLCLPVEAYAVTGIRAYADKLAGSADGLVARGGDGATILPPDDPLTASVHAAVRTCHAALGCRHYSLFDFRVDPAGTVWFIEAGLFCAFSEHSVIARTAAAAGIGLDELFATAIRAALTP